MNEPLQKFQVLNDWWRPGSPALWYASAHVTAPVEMMQIKNLLYNS